MKQYERMSKEEIDNAYYFSKGNCSECMAKHYCNDITARFTCVETVHDWLQKEIKMKKVHRYELIKSPEDVKKLKSEFEDHCVDCLYCKYEAESSKSGGCFCSFLIEEIEVEVEE